MAEKKSHHEACYGPGTDNEHCSICVMYRALGWLGGSGRDVKHDRPHCTKVEDPIEPYGHCKYFDPKGEHAAWH